MKTMLLALLLAAAPAPAPSAAPSLTLQQMLAICKLPPDEAGRVMAALPDRTQAAAMLLCIGYDRGQADLLDMLRGTPGKASAI